MSDEIKALVEQLEAWAPLVSSGYEVPAAGQAMMNASRTLTAQADEIERLNAIVKRVQGAAKTIMHHEGEELARLRKQAQEHHLAIRTLDSEREANALLTDEIERLRAALNATADEQDERSAEWKWAIAAGLKLMTVSKDYARGAHNESQLAAIKIRAALKAAQEVKA